MTNNILTIHNVSKVFTLDGGKKLDALLGINIMIKEGEIFVIVGPSGCGKSTLLRIITGLEKAFEGKVTSNQKLSIGDFSFVFQQFALLPWLNVVQNIELNLLDKGIPEKKRKERVYKELKRFHLEKFEYSFPHELSGGMKQRVGLARAFATDPKIIFMDEPFSELDSFTAAELRQDLLEIWKESKPTVVMVTHNVEEAVQLADRIAVMSARPGTIIEIIENNLKRPRKLRTKEVYNLEDKIYSLIKA